MEAKVKIRQRGPALVVARRLTVRLSDIGATISASFAEVYGYLGSREVPTTEPPFIVYHGSPGPNDTPFEIEVCAPVGRPIDPPLGWTLAELPAGTFASTMHLGPYDTLATTYERLGGWLPDHGYVVAGPPREVYLSEPATPAEETRTVDEFPVTLATAIGATR
jgi:effector-binding domain-containing protein